MTRSSPEGARRSRQSGLPFLVKTSIDRLAAGVGLVLTAPLLGMAAVAVRASMGGPVFFVQERPGRHARPVRIVKFRTMREACGPDGEPLPDAERLTRVGRFLRSTSIDELPQLWNVLRGDLSLVGPRPLLTRYLARYSPQQARRHEVVPGITGWAQVNGRNDVAWEEKFALDLWYVDHWSVGLDLRILAMTVGKVLRREGVSRQGQATTTEFLGAKGDREER